MKREMDIEEIREAWRMEPGSDYAPVHDRFGYHLYFAPKWRNPQEDIEFLLDMIDGYSETRV